MLGGIFEENKIKDKIQTFNEKILEENFWKEKLLAQKILKEKKFLENIFDDFNFTVTELKNLQELLELATKENDLVVLKSVLGNKYIMNLRDDLSLIAIQGPESKNILEKFKSYIYLLPLLFGVFIAADDQTVIVTILPELLIDMNVGINELSKASWTITAYLIGYAAMLPIMGNISDKYGWKFSYNISS